MKIELNPEFSADVPEPLYQAALECYLQYGLRKTTLEDIARKAGVSRSTIYRHLGGKPDIIQMIAMRELTALMGQIFDLLKPDAGLAEWAEIAFGDGLQLLRANKAVAKAINDEPELLSVLVIQPDQSPNILELTSLVLAPVVAGNKDAARLSVSPQLAATMIVRLLFSFVLINEAETDEPKAIARALVVGLLQN
ncbi:MAG: TetR/AcrR family transcriptional regulator [Alphaproteobacteria bacterium]